VTIKTARDDLMDAMIDHCSLGGETAVEQIARHRLEPPSSVASDRIILPAAAPARHSVTATLRARRSARSYASRAISRGHLAAALTAGHRRDDADWRSELTAGVGLDFLVSALRVDGLDAGLYLSREAGKLEPIAVIDQRLTREIVVQAEFADAAALILAVGHLAAALHRHGGHGYRLLAVRAGSAIHAAWLASISVGLVGCPFGGVIDAPLRRLAGIDGDCRALLLGLAIGSPHDADVAGA
jgi:nitroreductase